MPSLLPRRRWTLSSSRPRPCSARAGLILIAAATPPSPMASSSSATRAGARSSPPRPSSRARMRPSSATPMGASSARMGSLHPPAPSSCSPARVGATGSRPTPAWTTSTWRSWGAQTGAWPSPPRSSTTSTPCCKLSARASRRWTVPASGSLGRMGLPPSRSRPTACGCRAPPPRSASTASRSSGPTAGPRAPRVPLTSAS
mmetsp:Transcript_8840/g.29254  ORF Transcript_8840/g.29254 Transcript_8840/m.29254 type:complete len:201 (+) Transcript_8840:215-817(+)